MTGQAGEAGGITWLFAPGDRADRFAKAAASGADEVICDLEDSVAQDDKDQARRSVACWLAQGGSAWVRVNAYGTPHYEDDVTALAGLAGLRGIVVPKADDPAVLAALGQRLQPGTGILALIETAAGVLNAPAIARCPAVSRLAFGSVDFAADIDAAHDDEALLTARAALVLASRAAAKPAPVDGVTTSLNRPQEVTRDAVRARRLGFGGKLCIHPSQIAPAAGAFRPTGAEIARAREIVAAAELSGGGAGRSRGQMIDKPVVDRARRILSRQAAEVAQVVRYQATPGNGDEVTALLARHTAATRAEPGCRECTALRLEADPDSFVLYQRYASREAFEAHTASTHYESSAEARIRPLLIDRTVEFCQVVEPDE